MCRYSNLDFDECESDPCQNGADCYNGDNVYNCSCMPGYNGTNCETGMCYYHFYSCLNEIRY